MITFQANDFGDIIIIPSLDASASLARARILLAIITNDNMLMVQMYGIKKRKSDQVEPSPPIPYSNGDWHFGALFGIGSTYSGWYGEVGFGKLSAGYGATYYNSTTIGKYTTESQIVGTGKLSWGDISLSVSNDLFAERHKDRWRTSAVELGIGNFLIGTSVFTNWGRHDSPGMGSEKQIPVNDPIVGPHVFDKKEGKTYGAWKNGQVFSAPFWMGYRSGNRAYRIGTSARIVHSLTQNIVHKFMHTPYFLHYNNFKSGAFSYYGYYNPLTLWNN